MAKITSAETSYNINGQSLDQTAGYAQDILSNETITTSGTSDFFYAAGARQIDALIIVDGEVTGTNPTLQFAVNAHLVNTVVITDYSDIGTVQSYTGASITTGLGTSDAIIVVNNLIGDWIQVSWTVGGTSPSFGNTFCRIVVKK